MPANSAQRTRYRWTKLHKPNWLSQWQRVCTQSTIFHLRYLKKNQVKNRWTRVVRTASNPVEVVMISQESTTKDVKRFGYDYQRWSPRGRPWFRGHIFKSLASKLQVLENCPVLGSRTTLFFERLKFRWKTPETSRKICEHLFCFAHLEHRRSQGEGVCPLPN